jgi:hypothetical protein
MRTNGGSSRAQTLTSCVPATTVMRLRGAVQLAQAAGEASVWRSPTEGVSEQVLGQNVEGCTFESLEYDVLCVAVTRSGDRGGGRSVENCCFREREEREGRGGA